MSILASLHLAPTSRDARARQALEVAQERIETILTIPWHLFSRDRATAESVRADLCSRIEHGEEVYANVTTPAGAWVIWWPSAHSAQAHYSPAEVTALYLARVGQEVRA